MSYAGIIVNNEALAMDRIFTYKVPEDIEVSIGQRVEISFGMGNKKIDGFVLSLMEEPSEEIKRIKKIQKVYKGIYFRPEQVDFIEELRKRYLATYLDVIKLLIPRGILSGMKPKTREALYKLKPLEGKMDTDRYQAIVEVIGNHPGEFIKADLTKQGFSLSSVNTLIKHGFLEVTTENEHRYNIEEYASYGPKILNDEQTQAVDIMGSAPGTYLLHGITGSGKTEIFMEMIRKNLEAGHDSIVLLPEISLTPQMIERFKGRFGKNITIFHSRLSDGERFDEWHRVKSGKVKMAIGARSALFLPFNDLKLVVIDEEHESSYKSEMSPKYHAREVAEYMMDKNQGKLILASATPSVESYQRAKSEEITLIELKNRATRGKLPTMEVVDMREELLSGNRSIFSKELMTKMEEALDKKEQIILFLNRRGFSSFVSCRSCGFVFQCENCDISMTYHKNHTLMCHQCGARKNMPPTCPTCGSKYIKQFGTGTEKVEKAIKETFKEAKVMRMDRDTTRGKTSYETMYQDFKAKKYDILIGTQMISKGLDFEEVTVVGVLAADLSLNFPDYRASEKTFQLITQVAGRAGRGDKPGFVVIQTYSPENIAIESARDHDFIRFFQEEIHMREKLQNPPFTKLLHGVFSSTHEDILIKKVQEIGVVLRNNLAKYDKISVMGPTPSLISKIKNEYRWQILLRGDITDEIAMEVKDLIHLTVKAVSRDIKVSLDLNPSSMM